MRSAFQSYKNRFYNEGRLTYRVLSVSAIFAGVAAIFEIGETRINGLVFVPATFSERLEIALFFIGVGMVLGYFGFIRMKKPRETDMGNFTLMFPFFWFWKKFKQSKKKKEIEEKE
jgi:hypothetical protein